MHDQKKSERKPLTAAQRQQFLELEKAKGVLYCGQKESYDKAIHTRAALHDNAALLLQVPEAYSFYSYRREILLALWSSEPAASPVTDLVEELKLNGKIIEKDLKNYAAFVHRHWIYEELARRADSEVRGRLAAPSAQQTENSAEAKAVGTTLLAETFPLLSALLSALTREKHQCEVLLKLDERNFHAWNHRRWSQAKLCEAEALKQQVLATLGSDVDNETERGHDATVPYAALFDRHALAEMAFTTARIASNFSNYSAWHQRALTIRQALFDGSASVLSSSASVADDVKSTAAAGKLNFKDQPGNMEETSRKAWCEALMALLREDLHFLTQAIYCDPNDQSAWFYASFMLAVYEAFQTACPNFVASSSVPPVQTAAGEEAVDGAGLGADIEQAFLVAVVDLISEEIRLGDADCFLPHYFLFAYLARLLRETASEHSDDNSSVLAGSRKRVLALCVKLAEERGLLPKVEEAGEGQEVRSPLYALVQMLYRHLLSADGLRSGLYQDLWQVFRQHC